MYKITLYISFALAVLLSVMNQIALEYSLFWQIWWYDIPMHFLGGLVLGSTFMWFFGSLQEQKHLFSSLAVIVSVLFSVLICGALWELYEYVFNLTYNPHFGYVFDTTKDMFMDMFGALAVLLFYKRERATLTRTP